MHSCGFQFFNTAAYKKTALLKKPNPEPTKFNVENLVVRQLMLHTAYLGRCNLNLMYSKDTNLYYFLSQEGKINIYNVPYESYMNIFHPPVYSKLKNKSPLVVNVDENNYLNFVRNKVLLILRKFEKKKHVTLFMDDRYNQKCMKEYEWLYGNIYKHPYSKYKKLYYDILKKLSPIDIHFLTCEFFKFLPLFTNLKKVHKYSNMISIVNVPDFDNAYFNGYCCVYGEGSKQFSTVCALDVIGHELGHGIVKQLAGLEYQGESGALNESYADIIGSCFEFYLYEKYPTLNGYSDWTIGEDICSKPLRNMRNPEMCGQPSQKSKKFYVDPKSSFDCGGVHINSGIINKLFYTFCEESGYKMGLRVFINILQLLSPSASFYEFKKKALQYVRLHHPQLKTHLENSIAYACI